MPAETRDKMKADFYETLGVAKGADDKGSRAPIASWRCSSIPTAIPATMPPRQVSRKSSEAYECLKDPQKRAAYPSAMPRSRMAAVARGPVSVAALAAAASPTFSKTSLAR
jgi:hypothetical protein